MKRIIKAILRPFYYFLIKNVPALRPIYDTRRYQNPVTLRTFFFQKILGFNRRAYWPMHFTSTASGIENIYVGIDVCPGLAPGCYIQGLGKVYIDDFTGIGPNVGIISANHSLLDFNRHNYSSVKIGKHCWIAMNSVILPNVELGDFTTVAAGSVVTRSFKQGYCVLRGNPAEIVKEFPPETHEHFVKPYHDVKYYGYIPEKKFAEFRRKKLKV